MATLDYQGKWSGAELDNLLEAVDGQRGAHLVRNDELVNGTSISTTGVVTPNSPSVRYTPGYYRVRDFITANHIYMAERGWADKIMKCNIVLYDKDKNFIARLAYTQDKIFDLTDYDNAEYFRLLIVFLTQDSVDVVTDYADGDLVILTAQYRHSTIDSVIPTGNSGNALKSADLPMIRRDGTLDFGDDAVLVGGDIRIIVKNDIDNYHSISLSNPNTTSSAYTLVCNKNARACYCKKYDNPIGYSEIVIGGIRKLQQGIYIADMAFDVRYEETPVKVDSIEIGSTNTRAYAVVGWIENAILVKMSLPNTIYRWGVQCYESAVGVQNVNYLAPIDSGWISGSSDYQASWGNGYRWVRIAFSRVDNAPLASTDIDAIIAQMKAEVYDSTAATAMITENSREDYVFERSAWRYEGERIVLRGHPFACEKVLKMQDSSYYFQGAAMYDRYFVQFHTDNAEIEIYDVAERSFVQKLTMTSSGSHAGSGAFGVERYAEEDVFPLLYISDMDARKIQVYRLRGSVGNLTIALIQTISLPSAADLMYLPNCAIDVERQKMVLFGYSQNSWSSSAGNESIIASCDLPKRSAGNVTLAKSSFETFRLPFIYAEQGGYASNGRLLLSYGNTATEGGLLQIDLLKKAVTSRLDFSFLGEVEPEGIGVYDNKLWVSFQKPNQSIYKLNL